MSIQYVAGYLLVSELISLAQNVQEALPQTGCKMGNATVV
jgi:hypothetical protein